MWNPLAPKHTRTRQSRATRSTRATRARIARWSLAACALAVALLPAPGAAQILDGRIVTVLKSGLHSVFGGDDLLVTATEVGSTASSSTVTIEFRDASDRRRAYVTGTMTRTRPVRLRLPVPPGTTREQFRAIVTITALTNGGASQPIVGLEDIDVDSFSVIPKVICVAVEPSSGSGVEGNCDGWSVTRLTPQQAGAPD